MNPYAWPALTPPASPIDDEGRADDEPRRIELELVDDLLRQVRRQAVAVLTNLRPEDLRLVLADVLARMSADELVLLWQTVYGVRTGLPPITEQPAPRAADVDERGAGIQTPGAGGSVGREAAERTGGERETSRARSDTPSE